MRYLLICSVLAPLLFVSVSNSYGSNPKIDSLLNLLPEQVGADKLKTLDRLFDGYRVLNTDSAGYFANELFSMATRLDNKLYIVKAKSNLAIFHSDKGEHFEAEELALQAIKIAKIIDNPTELAATYRVVAGIYFVKGDVNKAIENVYKALNLYDQEDDFEGLVSCYNNIGLLYDSDKKYTKAIASYKKGLVFTDKYELKKSKLSLYNNLGATYRSMNKIDSSFYYHKKAIIVSVENNSKIDLVYNYLNIGRLFAFYIHQKDSAIFYFDKAYSFAEKSNKGEIPSILNNKGKLFYQLNKYKPAIDNLKEALKISIKDDDLRNQELANYYLYKCYQETQLFSNALKALEDLVDVQDVINMEEAKVKISRLQEKYENEKKRIKIEELEKEKVLNKKIRVLLLLGILLIVLVFGLIVSNLLIRYKKNKIAKEKAEQDLRFKNKQLTSQALMMMQKNTLLNDISDSLSEIKTIGLDTNAEIRDLKRKLKRGLNSEKDWELFKHYFESVNRDFFDKLKKINPTLTPAELKLSALTKLRFNIKETAALLNISEGSIKSSRYILRKKLGLNREDNIYNFLNKL